MKVGVISDTHRDKYNVIPYIVNDFVKEKVDLLIHCGDLSPDHANPNLFANIPLIYAQVANQHEMEEFRRLDDKWIFTKPGVPAGNPRNRIVDNLRERGYGDEVIYVGHDRSQDFIKMKEGKFIQELDQIRTDYMGVRYFGMGGSHGQFGLITRRFITMNPGAAALEESFDGAEYGLYDFDNKELSFKRFLPMELENMKRDPNYILENNLNIAVISDTAGISKEYNDPNYWEKLAIVLKERHNAKHLIIIGNIKLSDIGRDELRDFEVYSTIRDKQVENWEEEKRKVSGNWHVLTEKKPFLKIGDFRFLLDYAFGLKIKDKKELDLFNLEDKLTEEYHGLNYHLHGKTVDGSYAECEKVRFVSPRDTIKDRGYTIISLPKNEIFFGHIPLNL